MNMVSVKRAQISTEILILVGLMLLLLVPLLLYSYNRANVSEEDLAVQKAQFAAHRLATLADSVGYMGGDAAVIDEIEVPSYVKSVTVQGRDVVFTLETSTGKRQLVGSSAFILNESGLMNIHGAGTYFVEVHSLTNFNPGAAQVSLTLK